MYLALHVFKRPCPATSVTSLLTSGETMTENSATTVTSVGTQSSLVGQPQPDAAREVRGRRLLSRMQHVFHMIIVIYPAGVGGVSDSEPGAKNGFLGVLALRIYACTLHPIMDFSPFQSESTMRSWIDLHLWSIVLAVLASSLCHGLDRASPSFLPLQVPCFLDGRDSKER
jgi:hypothetical protein